MANILVYALQYEGAFNKNSLGAVSEAAKLAAEIGGEAHAIVVGQGVSDDLAGTLGNYGATKVLNVEGPEGLAQPVVVAMAAAVAAGDYGYAISAVETWYAISGATGVPPEVIAEVDGISLVPAELTRARPLAVHPYADPTQLR